MPTEAAPAPVIAIDGPSASGKGTVAARVAEALGFHYLDSGALYRLATLAAIESGTDLDDEAALAGVARGMDARFVDHAVLLGGRDVSEALRKTRREGGAAGAPEGLPQASGAGRRRPRHGVDRVPGRGAQGVPHRERRDARRAEI
jgi:hypothetical protein